MLNHVSRTAEFPPRVAVMSGDGIGPEVIAAARRVLDHAGFRARWIELPIGWELWKSEGNALPDRTLTALRTCGAALLGAITSKPEREAAAELSPELRGRGLAYRSAIVRLRQEMDLYACLRPARLWPGVRGTSFDAASAQEIDILTVRENTEGLYRGLEYASLAQSPLREWHSLECRPEDGRVAASLRITSERASLRIAKRAFEAARERGVSRVTLLEKPNILRCSGGLMVECARRVGESFPDIELEVENIDAACMHAVLNPARYGVVLAENLFGDIFSDLVAGLTGGPGLAASANLGDRFGVFEPVHGSAPDLEGTGKANPIATIIAGAMMARHLGQSNVADRIEQAVGHVLACREIRTPDLGGMHGTEAMTDAVLRSLEHPPTRSPADHTHQTAATTV